MENIRKRMQEVMAQLNAETEKYRSLEQEASAWEALAEQAGRLRDRIMSEKNSAADEIKAAAAGFCGDLYRNGLLPRIAELEKAFTGAAADLEQIRAELLIHAAAKHAAAAGRLEPIRALTVLYGQLRRMMEPGGRS